MIKKRVLLLIVVLFVSLYSIYANGSFERGELDEGDSKIFNTSEGFYILTLVTVSDTRNSAIFRLNNEMSGKLREKESYRFDDESEIVAREVISNEEGKDFAGYYLYLSDNKPLKVKLYSIDPDVCDFDKKCEDETSEYCCYDCRCSGDYDCIDNVCKGEEECKADSECDDSNVCTADSCVNGECGHKKEKGCGLGDKCVEKGYIDNNKYCDDNGWAVQKEKDDECDKDYECISGKCVKGKCIGKKGVKRVILFLLIVLLLIIVVYIKREVIIRKIKRRVI